MLEMGSIGGPGDWPGSQLPRSVRYALREGAPQGPARHGLGGLVRRCATLRSPPWLPARPHVYTITFFPLFKITYAYGRCTPPIFTGRM